MEARYKPMASTLHGDGRWQGGWAGAGASAASFGPTGDGEFHDRRSMLEETTPRQQDDAHPASLWLHTAEWIEVISAAPLELRLSSSEPRRPGPIVELGFSTATQSDASSSHYLNTQALASTMGFAEQTPRRRDPLSPHPQPEDERQRELEEAVASLQSLCQRGNNAVRFTQPTPALYLELCSP